MSSKKAKYFFAGFASALPLLVLLLFFVFEKTDTDDPFVSVVPDYGPSLSKKFSPATLMQNELKLGETGFIASATKVDYAENDNWAFYSISVEKKGQKLIIRFLSTSL